ncbi:MAG: GNAT family N-acetyltransferase [Proteobacteria bacterium]|nr:MAG: GNAT family N-acetyltransferase [Pseudomonadota bacterium]
MNTRIEPVTLENSADLYPLMECYYVDDHLEYDDAFAKKAVTELVASPGLGRIDFLVDDTTQKRIGYVVIAYGFSFEFGGREAFVDEVFVSQEYRGQGLGSSLIRHAIEHSKSIGIQGVRLETTPTNAGALRLYERLGFKNLGRSLLAYQF